MEQKEAALLVWMEEDEIKGRWPLAQAITNIGRAEDKDIVVDDRWVSRYHAQVRREEGRYVVVDQDSKNGTLVNGQRIAGPARARPRPVSILVPPRRFGRRRSRPSTARPALPR